MRKKRICIASSGLGHVARGIEAWADDLATALNQRGEEVILCKGGGEAERDFERVIACWKREDTKTHTLLMGMPSSLGWRIGMGSGYAIEQSTFTRGLIKVLREEDVDILHVQDPFVALGVQRASERGELRTRVVLGHGTEEPHSFLSKITYVQHLAPWHQSEAADAGFAKDAWTSIPNFVDTDLFHPQVGSCQVRSELGIPEDAFVVLVAAAIKRHHKRIDYVIREMASLLRRRPDCPLVLVVAGGWEQDTDELISMGRKLLGDRVRFLVRFPRERMADLYRAADVFALGSLKEMMPLALLEATSSGLPCVVHSHPVMQWMIGAGGLSVDMQKDGQLAETLICLVDDVTLRTQLGKQARLHATSQFGTDAVVDQISDYYQRVAGEVCSAETSVVSVVIPAFNAAGTIDRAIDSVLSQTMSATEIIVVNDGSHDDTSKVVRGYGDRVILIEQTNAKTAAARNRGMDAASGDFIAFLDADDYWEPEKLERQLAVMDHEPSVSIVGSRFYEQVPGQTRQLNAPRLSQLYDRALHASGPVAFKLGTMLWTGLAIRTCFDSPQCSMKAMVHGKLRFVSGLEPAEDRDFWSQLW